MTMQFPEHGEKAMQYEVMGHILADTAIGIGVELSPDDHAYWVRTLGAIATADDLFEADMDRFTPQTLLEGVSLDPDDETLLYLTERLLAVSAQAFDAKDIHDHLDLRALEAVLCPDIMAKDQADKGTARQWSQLAAVAEAGQYLDVVRDSREDAEAMPQFSASQLAIHGTKRVITTAATIRPKTWRSLLRSSHQHGLTGYLFRHPMAGGSLA